MAIAHRVPITLDTLPDIDLRHLVRLSDDTGLIQHALYGAPDPHHGYCTDDNARALIASIWNERYQEDKPPLAPDRYLTFLTYALNPVTGRFRNFMAYDRHWLEEIGSEDSHARAMWALGVAVQHGQQAWVRELATNVFRQAMIKLHDFMSLRPWAYGLLALHAYLEGHPDDEEALNLRTTLAERLFGLWQRNACEEWPWWEDELSWGNAKLPHGLLIAGVDLHRTDMVETALKALDWLLEVQTAKEGHLTLVGNRGWYKRGKSRAQFDQQPIEAQGIVQTCCNAAIFTGQDRWVAEALRGFDWFHGRNDAGKSLYNHETGGCHDGLTREGLNKNQGAESCLAYVLSLLELHMLREHLSE